MRQKTEEDLKLLASSIAKSYKKHAIISHIDCDALPQREEIKEILLTLREMLFPGYFCGQTDDIDTAVSKRLDIVYSKLSKQIFNVLLFQTDKNSSKKEDVLQSANDKTLIFLRKIPSIRDILATDAQAAYEGDPAASSADEVIFSYPGIFAITIHRIAHELYLLKIPLIPRIMSEYAHALTGIDIHPGAQIGKYFFIDHGTGVVIGETTQIGDYVRIYQGVTLGALSLKDGQALRGTKRHPTLKDNVIVYANTSILGGETIIGEGVVIGGNVFITSSVAGKTNVSMKKPELQYIDKASKKSKKEKDIVFDWII
jgi:serine O-acetyltransferase